MTLPFDAHLEITLYAREPTERDLEIVHRTADELHENDPRLWPIPHAEFKIAERGLFSVYRSAIVIISWQYELRQLALALEWVFHEAIPSAHDREQYPWFQSYMDRLGDDTEFVELRQEVTKVTLWHRMPEGATR